MSVVVSPPFSTFSSTQRCSHLTVAFRKLGRNRQMKRRRDCSRKAGPEQKSRLKQAASEYAEGLAQGMDEDDLVALQLGATDVSQLTDRQQQYVNKIKAKLTQQAMEEKRAKEARSLRFAQGKTAYGTGQYAASEVLFTEALEMEGELSPLGGEIQLWLALAYQACGKEQQCIELYKSVENNHPLPKIKRQAAELRYIMEAPKLKIGPDEKVTIPVLEDQDRYVKPRGAAGRMSPRPPAVSVRKRAKTLEEEFWENYRPPIPDALKNRYVLVASGIVATGLAWYSVTLRYLMAK